MPSPAALYDTIGTTYADLRRPDPRIAAAIDAALGSARTVINVGAGTGSYESDKRDVTAVEPSFAMIRQRPASGARVVQAVAEALPFADGTFDAATALLTIHHWRDRGAGLRELRRVTRGPIAILTFDPAARPWLTDYLPALADLDEAVMPTADDYAGWLGPVRIIPLPIPYDCIDGFLYAYWRRPAAYLDPVIRSGISSFWAIGDVHSGLRALQRDVADGAWKRRYAELAGLDAYDAGYRLVVSDGG